MPIPTASKILISLFAVLGTACSPLAPINFLVPEDTYKLLSDQSYGSHERQTLDVYLPLDGLATAPVVVFFYGGTWRGGDRADYAFVGEALASRGVIAAIADYRVYPQVTYPDFLEDSAAATAWVRQQQDSWQPEPQPLFVMGHSSGAYNAAMLALDQRWLDEQGLAPQQLSGWIGLSGPYEFLPIVNPDVKPIFPYPDTPVETQPYFHAGAESPPALLLAATPDDLVDPERNTGQLTEKLGKAGVSVETHYYESLHHLTIVVAMAKPLQWWAPVVDEVHDFIMRHSSASARADY